MSATDDSTLKLTPMGWYAWGMRTVDDALVGGAMKTPGYLLPLGWAHGHVASFGWFQL
jgi:hypothetical protein